MATPAEVANDLEAQARRLERTGNDHIQRSLERGAATIRELIRENAVLATGAVVVSIRLDGEAA